MPHRPSDAKTTLLPILAGQKPSSAVATCAMNTARLTRPVRALFSHLMPAVALLRGKFREESLHERSHAPQFVAVHRGEPGQHLSAS